MTKARKARLDATVRVAKALGLLDIIGECLNLSAEQKREIEELKK